MSDPISRIIERSEREPAFLDRLLSDPRAAVSDMSVSLSDDEVATLTSLTSDEFRAFAAEFKSVSDPERRRAAC